MGDDVRKRILSGRPAGRLDLAHVSHKPIPKMPDSYDTIVIGAGQGGGPSRAPSPRTDSPSLSSNAHTWAAHA